MADAKITLKEKLEKEANRPNAEDWCKAYLYREGTFLHAFNQSAWIVATKIYNEEVRSRMEDGKELKVTHTIGKQVGDYLLIGFPARSLTKYIQGCDMRDNDGVIEVTMPSYIITCNAEECQVEYESFASAIPIKEQKPKKGSSLEVLALGQNLNGRTGMFEIIKQIMAFRIEESTPIDAVNFLVKLKGMVGDLM